MSEGIVFFLYRWFGFPLLWLVLQMAAIFNRGKIGQLVRAKNRKDFHLKMSEEKIRAARPFWIHAASGEIEYARPVLRELKKRFPQIPILVTYSSPSAIRLIQGLSEVDAWGPGPWEFSSSVKKFLRRFEPRATLIARTDLWPVLAKEVAADGKPLLMFSATFAANSSRLRGWTRFLTAGSMKELSRLQVVSQEDCLNLGDLAADLKIEVCGDTRFDQVLYRLENSQSLPADLRPLTGPVFIAGSTWPEDEDILLPAFAKAGGKWKFLLAPHEVGEKRLSDLEKRLQSMGLSSQRFSAGGPWKQQILLLDKVGILAELYAWGDLAFVGGSFRKQVHSVMEALAAGLRVIVGPFHENNREALAFRHESVSGKPVVQAIQSGTELQNLLLDQSLLGAKSEIRTLVKARQGATTKVVDWCESQIETPPSS